MSTTLVPNTTAAVKQLQLEVFQTASCMSLKAWRMSNCLNVVSDNNRQWRLFNVHPGISKTEDL